MAETLPPARELVHKLWAESDPRTIWAEMVRWDPQAIVEEEVARRGDRTALFEEFRSLLEDEDFMVRADAAEWLLRIDPGRGVETILPLLDDPSWEVRRGIIEWLHHYQSPRAEERLMQIVKEDSNPNLRYTAAWALEGSGGERAIPVLEWVIQTDDGRDYEDDPVSRRAEIAVNAIRERLAPSDS